MNWAVAQLGACAVTYPGFGTKDHGRAAVQLLSTNIARRTVFGHLGWRKLDGSWVYLHASGGIGENGCVESVEVSVPELQKFILPDPPTGDSLKHSVKASLRMLQVAPYRVTVPLYGSTCRAVLGLAYFSVHLAGGTGAGKTELLALAQQHFGAGLDSHNLPGSCLSTGNALDALAFYAKDALFGVDDFAPMGSVSDVQRHHREADRLLRAQGNHAGRQRLRADASLKPTKTPRGLILSTGEDIPKGQSLRARLFTVEVGPTDVDWNLLTLCQEDAKEGLYAQAMAGFVKWLAPQYGAVLSSLREEVASLRQKAVRSASHRRTPEIVANLAVGLRYFLQYAQDSAAMTKTQAEALWEDCWMALGEVATAQREHQASSDPVRWFLVLLGASIASGNAHVAGPEGNQPENARGWGWREVTVGTPENERTQWRPQGNRVGWVIRTDLYLDADAAYAAAQDMGRTLGDTIALTPRALHKRLNERGLLVTTPKSRETLKVRRTLEGRRRKVLHLRSDCLTPEPDQTGEGGTAAEGRPASGSTYSPAWSGSEEQQVDNITSLSPINGTGCEPLVRLGRSDTGINEPYTVPAANQVPTVPFSSDAQPVYPINNLTSLLTSAEGEDETCGEETF